MNKKIKLISVLMVVLMLFSMPVHYAGASVSSPKDQLLERIKKSNFNYMDITKGSLGTFNIELKELSGRETVGIPADLTKGAKLGVDYKINSSQKKAELNITAEYGKEELRGSFYVDGDKLIIPKDVAELLAAFDPTMANMEQLKDVKQYLYSSSKKESEEFWKAMQNSDPQKFIPVYREFAVFFIEAVPDKYFSLSPSGDMVVLSIDENGIKDIFLSLIIKVIKDPERFENLVADAIIAADPSKDREEIKKELGSITDLGIDKNKLSEQSPELKELMSELKFDNIKVEKFVAEFSVNPSGEDRFSAAVAFNFPEFSGRVDITTAMSGNRESAVKSSYSLGISGKNSANSISGFFKGEYSQTGGVIKEKDLLELNVKDLDGNTELRGVLQLTADIKEDRDIRVNVPVLTESNSTDMDKLIAKNKPPKIGTDSVGVLLNGQPVLFDVPPYLKDGKRVMVPVRSLSESMGFDVSWTEPNRIGISRDDLSIVMYVNERTYTVNGEKRWMDIPPVIKNGRNMVPVRFIVEEMGCEVEYDDATSTVYVYTE
ncbi:MAG: copper amine oxidase N-terminal domain-containing protein [Bacillota bacterium]